MNLDQREAESRRLKVENLAMAKKIQGYECTEDSLKEDEVRVKFYTGLSYTVLMTIFNFVASSINLHHQSALSKFQQFFIVLVKLRLNLCDQDIAYRFGVSQSTVTKNFRKWINACFIRLSPLITQLKMGCTPYTHGGTTNRSKTIPQGVQ